MTGPIYHITSRASWEAGQASGEYKAESLGSQGFIHCSKAEQLLRVANTFYNNQPDLVILAIDPSRVKSELRWEAGTDKADELFPHIYGPLNLESVVRVYAFVPGHDGSFTFPQGLK